MDSGIEITGEVLVRRLALLGGGSLASAIYYQPVMLTASVSTTPPTESIPSTTGDLTSMLISSFNKLFTEPKIQVNDL